MICLGRVLRPCILATSDLYACRSREEKVHEEENRLQMVSEMAKKLGTNISKEELINLRRQARRLIHIQFHGVSRVRLPLTGRVQ